MNRFLVDAQLPPALARWLSEQGHVAEHVFDFGGDGTTDQAILQCALETGASIITKDDDFLLLSARMQECPPIVWVRVGNTRRAALLDLFQQRLPALINALQNGERVIELV